MVAVRELKFEMMAESVYCELLVVVGGMDSGCWCGRFCRFFGRLFERYWVRLYCRGKGIRVIYFKRLIYMSLIY